MAQQLKEPEQTTALAEYVQNKLFKEAPSRRSMIKAGLAGLLIGGGMLSESIRHAYGSHGSPTDILDDQISSESASLEQFVELENIAEASVIAPVAGRAKIFRSSADNLIKRKNPDNSVAIMEQSAFSAFLNVAQDWTAIQTFTLQTNFEADINMDGNNIFNLDQIRGQTDNRLKLQSRREDSDIAFLITTPNVSPAFTETTRLTITGRLATAVATWANITHSGFVLGALLNVNSQHLLQENNTEYIKVKDSGGTIRNVFQTVGDDVVYGDSGLGYELFVGNGAGGAIKIINLNQANPSTLAWTNVEHTGLKLAGSFDANGQNINNVPAIGLGATSDVNIFRAVANVLKTNDAFFLQNLATPSTLANSSGIFAQDVSSSSELFAIDEAGNTPQLTPHNFTLFNPDLSLSYPWSYYAKNDFLGIEIGVDIAQAIKDLQGITKKKYTYTKTYQKKSWIDEQSRVKREIDEYQKSEAEREELERREKLIRIEMAKEIEVTKEEAIESQEIEERERLTTPIYDDDGRLVGEEPIMVPTGEYELNRISGKLEPILIQDSIIVGTRIEYKLKENYFLNARLRKFHKITTRGEAEVLVPSEPITFTPYRIKSPPQWMIDRGAN